MSNIGTPGAGEGISSATEKHTLTQRLQTTDEEHSLGSSNDHVVSNKDGTLEFVDDKAPALSEDSDAGEKDDGIRDNSQVIVTGADLANKLLSLRDDKEQTLTFRSLFLATGLSAFQAAVSQIYNVSTLPSQDLGVFS